MGLEDDLSGTVLAGRYKVLSLLGGGGMGTVHAGEHIGVGRKVAIKVLRREAVAHPSLVERFRREARLTARIEHEHVVECLDVGVTDDGLCFYVMEWLRGEDLQALLRRERTLSFPRVRSIVAQICRALAAAHERGVVHRDLKPGNIFLVQRDGNPDFVKVLDFGIAKLIAPDEGPTEVLTRIGEVVGTTPYMAPELAAGEPFDHRIDIYALGIILAQSLTGRLPFRGRTPRQVLVEILKGDPPKLVELNHQIVVSPALEAIVQRALHRDPAQRFPDMAALHEALLDLPDDACVPIAGFEPPDPSRSEESMVASMLGPMTAGVRSPGHPDTRLTPEAQQTRRTVVPVAVPLADTSPTPTPGRVSPPGESEFETRRTLPETPRTPLPGQTVRAATREPGLEVRVTQVPGLQPLSVEVTTRTRKRRGPGLALLGVLAVLLAAGVAWYLWLRELVPLGDMLAPAVSAEEAVVPAVERPIEPITNTATPAVAQRVEPAVEEPVEPAVEKPAAPVAEKPVEPVVEAQAEPEPPSSPVDPSAKHATIAEDTKARPREGRSEFDDVMRKATAKLRRCLEQAGFKAGMTVRFDVAVEARTGRIKGATARPPYAGMKRLGDCVVESAKGSAVRPAPDNEWRRSYEFSG